MVKRLLGPLLIIALGMAFLFGLGSSPVDAGNITPCTTNGGIGNVNPCTPTTTECPVVGPIGAVDPCATTTTEVKDTTTSAAPNSTSTAPKSTTSVLGSGVTSTPTKTPTTVKTGVSSGGVTRNTGQLARTGSNNGPLTGVGAGLVLLGFGLLVTSTRIHRRRTQA